MVLDGVYACVSGQEIEVPEAGDDDAPDLEAIHAQEEAWGYCTEFLVRLRRRRGRVQGAPRLGRSVFVVDQDDVVKVHVHAGSRRGPLYAGSFGRLAGVKIDDMEAQVRSREPEGSPAARLGVAAASRGDGNRALFEQMGAVVIEGGQARTRARPTSPGRSKRRGPRPSCCFPTTRTSSPQRRRSESW